MLGGGPSVSTGIARIGSIAMHTLTLDSVLFALFVVSVVAVGGVVLRARLLAVRESRRASVQLARYRAVVVLEPPPPEPEPTPAERRAIDKRRALAIVRCLPRRRRRAFHAMRRAGATVDQALRSIRVH
jgi:hypothetical protein